MKIPTFCAPPSPGTNRRQVSLAVRLEIDECNIYITTLARAKTHITINGHW